MYRQHPYAGYGLGPRRGGSPPGPGPDRPRNVDGGHRRGRGRNRGASANFTAPREQPGYTPTPQPQRDAQYSEDPYFSNPPRNDLIQSAYSENGYGRDQDTFSGNGTPRQSSTKGQETPAHDSLIEERLQRERPCRTLFIRNIKYETDSREFRLKFEEFGEIKTFFDLISHRGMVFCTYFDMRAAERAKERLQGTDLAGRPIDVHYSLPREDQAEDRNQGILIVTLIDSPTHAPIDDTELKRKCAAFGDVKSISSHGRPDRRTVEFYDTRSCEEADSKLRHQSLGDGIMETEYGDAGGQPAPGPAMKRAQEERAAHTVGPRGRRGRGRGGRGGGDSGRWEDERTVPRREWGTDRNAGRDEFGRDILNDRPVSPPPVRGRFDRPERERSPERSRSFASEPPLDPAEKARRDQAKKVQELLDALKQSSSAPSSATPMPVAPQAPQQYYAAQSAAQLPNPYAASMLPPGLSSLVPLVAQPQMPGMPPTQQSTYGAYEQLLMSAPHLLAGYMPPPPVAPSIGGGYNPAGPSANETNGMPMNLMALLERQNQHSVQSLPPPTALRPPPAPNVPQSQPSIQDIMALLQKTSQT